MHIAEDFSGLQTTIFHTCSEQQHRRISQQVCGLSVVDSWLSLGFLAEASNFIGHIALHSVYSGRSRPLYELLDLQG